MLNIILGAVTGALSGATGGKVDLGRAVEAATVQAARRADVPLAPAAAPAVAEAIVATLPPPRAMEPLWPQVLRQGLVFVGGFVAAKGWVSAEDWAILSGAILAAGPVVYRIGSTLIARAKA